MIKAYHRRKLSKPSDHRKALLRNLCTDLFLYEKIKTTLPKAKELQWFSERLITKAKVNNLIARRRISQEIKNKQVVKKIFDVLVPRYVNTSGGFTQIFKIGSRAGDSAYMAIIKLYTG